MTASLRLLDRYLSNSVLKKREYFCCNPKSHLSGTYNMTGSYSAGITWSGGGPHYKVYPTYENANGNGFTISPGKNDDTTAWEWKVTFHNALNLTPSSFWFADTTR